MAYSYASGHGSATGLSAYSSRLAASDSYLSDASLIGSSRYLSADPLTSADAAKYSAVVGRGASVYLGQRDARRLSSAEIGAGGSYSTTKMAGGIGAAVTPWTGFDGLGAISPAGVVGIKRPTEALYHQTILGSHNTIGQSEALYSTNSLAKRPRIETTSNLPIYPQRPGEKDCAHYMMTRTCKFGASCKFDHPLWVPEGGIPDWKEIPVTHTSESLPERPGEPDCPYYLKTQRCKFGARCKFNHPKDKVEGSVGGVAGEGAELNESSVLPERPSEPICAFYAKTGKCKFGASCIFHHPKDIQIPTSGQDSIISVGKTESRAKDNSVGDSKPPKTFTLCTPALLHNSKGLPIRLGETDCPFYLKTGSCKYGATCRYNHPDRNSINPSVAAAVGQAVIQSSASSLPIGVLNPAANLLPNIDPRLTQASLAVGQTMYPQRPGQMECDFYMKTGQCKFGERCKFHHPIDRSAPTSAAKQALQQNVKLTLAGLPRREGSVACPYYMKTGACKYGATCRFDHPPPGEAIAMATGQANAAVGIGTGAAVAEGEGTDAEGPD